jgi:tRNA(Arg) A34 adenosine deaminase TadA
MKKWVVNQTIETAKTSSYPVFRHGAVFESGGRIIFKSTNVKKSVTPDASMSVHAEVAGLKAVLSKSRLKRKMKVDLYVCRVSPNDKVMLSRPCEKCLTAIKQSGIVNQIFYSTNYGWEEARI